MIEDGDSQISVVKSQQLWMWTKLQFSLLSLFSSTTSPCSSATIKVPSASAAVTSSQLQMFPSLLLDELINFSLSSFTFLLEVRHKLEENFLLVFLLFENGNQRPADQPE